MGSEIFDSLFYAYFGANFPDRIRLHNTTAGRVGKP